MRRLPQCGYADNRKNGVVSMSGLQLGRENSTDGEQFPSCPSGNSIVLNAEFSSFRLAGDACAICAGRTRPAWYERVPTIALSCSPHPSSSSKPARTIPQQFRSRSLFTQPLEGRIP
jgi:hypothetical protein